MKVGQPNVTVAQRALAEFVGTALVVFIAAGAVVFAGSSSAGGLTLAGDGSAVVAIAAAYGLAVAAVMVSIARISGGHVNPAVTIGAFVAGRLELRETVTNLGAQLAGAVAGAALLRSAVPEGLWEPVALGTPEVNSAFGISAGQAVLAEAVLAFFVVWVFFAVLVDRAGPGPRAGAWAVGLAVFAGALMATGLSGAAMNPVRAFGPALVASAWSDQWVYWVGPIAGGIVAAVVYDLAILRARDEPAR